MLEKFQYSMNTFINQSDSRDSLLATLLLKVGTTLLFRLMMYRNLTIITRLYAEIYANGIMNGKFDTKFAPTETMTRAEICATAVRVVEMIYAKLKAAVPANYKLPNTPSRNVW